MMSSPCWPWLAVLTRKGPIWPDALGTCRTTVFMITVNLESLEDFFPQQPPLRTCTEILERFQTRKVSRHYLQCIELYLLCTKSQSLVRMSSACCKWLFTVHSSHSFVGVLALVKSSEVPLFVGRTPIILVVESSMFAA